MKLFKLSWVFIYKLKNKLVELFCSLFYPIIIHNIKQLQIRSIKQTITSLIDSNKSLSRFGDGEINWALGNKNYGSFEKESKPLRNRLIQVLISNRQDLEIGLPDAFRGLNQFIPKSANFWRGFISKNWFKLRRYLFLNRVYYNTGFSRFYIDYKNKNESKYLFYKIRKIWQNKKVLIVEGEESRLGVGNNFFDNTECIKRIECPSVDAFEYYRNILNVVSKFLKDHNNYLVLIALGPTATVLSYDLCRLGYRAIDIGHVDLEYEWFLHGATRKINIPTRYVNSYRIKNGKKATHVYDDKYTHEIFCHVK